MDDLVLAYWKHAEIHYRRDGQSTGTMDTLKPILRRFRELFGRTVVKNFRPSYLEAFQTTMVGRDCSRSYINDMTARIKLMFRWGVRKEMVPVEVLQRLDTVPGLQKGRTEARETEPVEPVDDKTVDATLPHLQPTVADMVSIQRLTGMRPQDVSNLRPMDIDRTSEVWLYRPAIHKAMHHNKTRVVCIGPKAQEILLPYMLRDAKSYCFSPAESEQKRRANQRENRQSPMTPSQAARKPKRKPARPPADQYCTESYRRAIHRACDKAFQPKSKLKGDALKAWRSEHRWSPNQLRHTAGTEIRKRYGLEAAQCVLGHAKADTTQIYAERDLTLAVQVARQMG